MPLTAQDLDQITRVVVSITAPMFEQVLERHDKLDGRMGKVETRMGKQQARIDSLDVRASMLYLEFRGFKSDMPARLKNVQNEIDGQTLSIQDRLANMDEYIELSHKFTNRLESDTPAERYFAKLPLDHQAAILYCSLKSIA